VTAPVQIVSSADREAWLLARRAGITATDVAKAGASPTAATIRRIISEKRGEAAGFSGNASTAHGTKREPVIAEWVRTASAAGRFGSGALVPCGGLFAHPDNPRHLATPDGWSEDWDYYRELVEIKTTNHAWASIPRDYLRQVWWQQYVLGAERTLVVWEQHDGGVPIDLEPQHQWVKRDEAEITELKKGAALLLAYLDDEAPLPPVDVDNRISKYLRLQEKRDELDAEMREIESWLRDKAGDEPLSVLGTRGDLSIGKPSTQKRFDSAAFQAAQPDVYKEFQKEIAVRPRFSIKPVERPADDEKAEEAAA
jgi:hypothetical protein